MNSLIRTFTIAAILNARSVVAQTITPTMTPVTSTVTAETFLPRGIARREAPVGHRQPSAKDVTSEESAAIERIDQESAELDRKLRICRGC